MSPPGIREQCTVGVVVALCCCLLSPRAAAEDAEQSVTQRARALFSQGVELSDRHDWTAAVERFEEALALRAAPAIRFNLAVCYVELGRHVEAAEQLDLVLADPAPASDLGVRPDELLPRVEEHVATLRVRAGELGPGAVLSIDGREVSDRPEALPIRVEPGTHVVTATVDGEEVARAEVDAPAATITEVRLERARTPVEAAITSAASDDDEDARVPLARDWRLWVGVGAGVVAIVTAVVVGVAVGAQEEFEDPVRGTLDPDVLVWR